jgi:hypothetical protein
LLAKKGIYMVATRKEEKKVIDKVFGSLSIIAALVLLIVGGLCWNAGKNIVSTVDNNLIAQKIYFPSAGDPAFSAKIYQAAQKYAGQLVDNGTTAKAYANDYLGPEINLVGGGQTLSEITTAATANPQNMELQQLQGTMFQLVTTQNVMYASNYGDWLQGMAVRDIGVVALVAGVALLLVAGAQFMQYKRLS